MREIILDARRLTEKRSAQAYLKERFGFPDYYGGNLDAFHDMLTGLSHTRVTVTGEVSGYGQGVLAVLRDSERENPGLILQKGQVYGFQDHAPSRLLSGHLNLGGEDPAGERIEVTSLYLLRGGRPWVPVIGEYHFSRDSRENWYRELCKMRDGGVTAVSTYLFWIYHEETEGTFDFTGDRDIRAFLLEAKRAGLEAVLRIGPWAHAECRNGGFPDWLLEKPWRLRENDPDYLNKVKIWFEKISEQVRGLFYKDGGNIVAIQLENELTEGAEHLRTLKELAREAGLDAPLYTATGWNNVFGARIPVDEVLPVFSGYTVTPWERGTGPFAPSHSFIFTRERNDTAIDARGRWTHDRDGWRLPYERYPFATCELGGGIEVTHHRRPIIRGMEIYAMALTKLGCGSNLPGYYMFKGGRNKRGREHTFNESRAAGAPNDYPALSYDFQAPISQYGEIREQYRLLNLLNLFVRDFGEQLAPTEYVPAAREVWCDDFESLRYAMRVRGRGGFVFVNHFQRLHPLADIEGAVIDTGEVTFPPLDIRGEVSFFLPFHLDLGGVLLEYATAQPVCWTPDTVFFVEIPGIRPQYKFQGRDPVEAKAGRDSRLSLDGIGIVTLSWDEARYLRRLPQGLYLGEGADVYACAGEICCAREGSFTYYKWTGETFEPHFVEKSFREAALTLEPEPRPFDPDCPEELSIGGEREVSWYRARVDSPQGFVEFSVPCDVSQLYIDGRLFDDNYYYGRPWRLPAGLLYGRDCHIAASRLREDFYREF